MGQALGGEGPNPVLLQEEMFHVLLTAFEMHVQCSQINGVSEELHHSNLIGLI